MRIELPQVGESVTEGTISKWLKSVGDQVNKYEPLLELITDKVTMEIPSPVTGILKSTLAEEGETVPMGNIIAEIDPIDKDGIDPVDETMDRAPSTAIDRTGVLLKNTEPVGPTGSGGPKNRDTTPSNHNPNRTKVRYSPAVLRLATQNGLNLSKLKGTGINGRITKKDVLSYLNTGNNDQEIPQQGIRHEGERNGPKWSDSKSQKIPLNPIRKSIAENMAKSSNNIPDAWTMVEVDVSGLVRLRQELKETFRAKNKISLTYLPFVADAVAKSLKKNPILNSSWDEDTIILKEEINIGIAVATSKGLLVPVIHQADTFNISDLAQKSSDLAKKAREGTLDINDIQGGTFTLNNTGALGSVLSKPIINHPQAAIMTTESIVRKPVVISDGISIRDMMNICVSFDHRIMDGYEVSQFTSSVKTILENIDHHTLID